MRIAADMPQVRPHFLQLDPVKDILDAGISPTGQRAVFEAHGEIVTVPAEKGDIRNITNTPGAAERDPAWSPDGTRIAYFSDESGEYALYVRPQDGLGEVRKIDLGNPPSFFYAPTWSPDSKKIAYSDKRLNLWFVDLEQPTPVKVDTDRFDSPAQEFDDRWSPDSRWLAYTKQLPNQLHAVFVYSLAGGKATQVTDGMSDALYPVFDRGGKYLYFIASTDVGLTAGWIDMTSIGHPVTRSVYAAVLKKDVPSPIAPQSDEEKANDADKEKKEDAAAPANAKKGEAKAKDGKAEKAATVEIDFAGLDQRIVALPIPAKNYRGLFAGKEGKLFLVEGPLVDTGGRPAEAGRVEVRPRDAQDGAAARGRLGVRALGQRREGALPLGPDVAHRGFRQGPQGRRWRARNERTSRCTSTRRPSGRRCTARSGGSSATSSTTRTSTASTWPRPRRRTRRTWRGSRAATT